MTYLRNSYIGLRRLTREVRVGDVGIGAENPIRVQSMTTTDTLDTSATCDQVERLVDVGCEIVRITAPSIRDAENLGPIKKELQRRRIRVPLVADIHFTPNAAMIAAEIVEKVRVNPGNYADKKKFEVREYTESEYDEELIRVGDRFRPLVRRCAEHGVAMRIGTNHGSLSDRIMNRHGDTPLGMVESALEFLDVCEQEHFHEIVFSMKSSNPQVAIQAYRLLAARLAERSGSDASYPFHVGVTEAGDGEDGRVKSAIGIGALLEDGLGDTIRVSLTEDPVKEVPVAEALARRAEGRWRANLSSVATGQSLLINSIPELGWVEDPYSYVRRSTTASSLGGEMVGGDEPVRVELEWDASRTDRVGFAAGLATGHSLAPDLLCEGIRIKATSVEGMDAARELFKELSGLSVQVPIVVETSPEFAEAVPEEALRVALAVDSDSRVLATAARCIVERGQAVEWALSGLPDVVVSQVDVAVDASSEAGLSAWTVSLESPRTSHAVRAAVTRLHERGAGRTPLWIRHKRSAENMEMALLDAAVDLGSPLCDGLGDGISLSGFEEPAAALDLAYRILQGARQRTTRTEYISCPSCGRTLFDLEETTARIKEKTEHLKGVKIAVMGCIVNGPGEMADADFGYVGSGPGRVNLYVGHEVVARGVGEDEAPSRLEQLIRDHGSWVDPGGSSDA